MSNGVQMPGMKIRAVREDPNDPCLDCYQDNPTGLAKLYAMSAVSNKLNEDKTQMAYLAIVHDNTVRPEGTGYTNVDLSAQSSQNRQAPENKPSIKVLPNLLTVYACLEILETINVPTEINAAAGERLDIAQVDKALATTPLSVSDRIRFKEALKAHGLLPKGKPFRFGFR